MIFIYAIIALLITFILVPILIPTLKRMKFGQSIREEGPQSHMKKTGTPTMGGLTFLISIIISSIIKSNYFVTICNNRFWSYWIY